MTIYKYTVKGEAADGQTWECVGTLDGIADVIDAAERAMMQAFQKLTQGKAVFGHPGVGCAGPYKVNTFLLERES